MDVETAQASGAVLTVERTTCCVVGGGPAGVVLAYLLARNGVAVTLLESHLDFDRDFRGDTLHPSTLEVLDELGLADRLLELPHTKLRTFAFDTANGTVVAGDFARLHTRFPYVALMPQSRFLDFMTAEAQRFSTFRLAMGARVEKLIEEHGEVRGVQYRALDGWHELRALLTVGADGRFSRLRKLGGFSTVASSQPMDVLWFRIARRADDPHGLMGRFGRGHFMVELDRGDQWQVAFAIPKGGYQRLHEAGLPAFREAIVETAPELAERVDAIHDWHDVSVLSVEADHLTRWYRPGLLLIGDAAHVMSPVGGNGINYAIMDAVAAANILTDPLKAGHVSVADLARVQRRRELPVRIIQAVVNVVQDRFIKAALDPNVTVAVPSVLRLSIVRGLLPRLIGFGIRPEHVKNPEYPLPRQLHAGRWLAAAALAVASAAVMRRLTRRS
jgi:2-polyprenyl-6-methoxyphenol hydroxylase-like FAD-dependent oxidoreductase